MLQYTAATSATTPNGRTLGGHEALGVLGIPIFSIFHQSNNTCKNALRSGNILFDSDVNQSKVKLIKVSNLFWR